MCFPDRRTRRTSTILALLPARPQLRACLGLQPFSSQLAAPPARGGLLVPPLGLTHFLVADTADFVAVQFSTQGGCS